MEEENLGRTGKWPH